MALIKALLFVLLFYTISGLGAVNPTLSGCTPGSCDPQVTTLLTIVEAFRSPNLTDTWEGNDACRDWTFIVCTDTEISTINFAMQHLGGSISPAFANLTNLRHLYLDDNNLTGEIPSSLTSLPRLQTLDLSNNDLSGVIPKFGVSVELNTKGNPLLSPGGTGTGTGESDSNGSPSSVSPAGIVIAAVVFAVFKWI